MFRPCREKSNEPRKQLCFAEFLLARKPPLDPESRSAAGDPPGVEPTCQTFSGMVQEEPAPGLVVRQPSCRAHQQHGAASSDFTATSGQMEALRSRILCRSAQTALAALVLLLCNTYEHIRSVSPSQSWLQHLAVHLIVVPSADLFLHPCLRIASQARLSFHVFGVS